MAGVWQAPRAFRAGGGVGQGRRSWLRWLTIPALLGKLTTLADQAEEDLAALIVPPELSSWEHSVTARLRAGYDDNVLLSPYAPEQSAFLGAGLDGMLWRPLGERGTFEAFFNGEYQHFLSTTNVKNEETAFGLLQVKEGLGDAWQVKGAFEYLYQNQILDVSATEPTLEVVDVEGSTFTVRPALQRKLGPGWLELEVPLEWQLYQSPLDDTRGVAPRLTGGLTLGRRDELTLAYAWGTTWYATEEDRTTEGTPIPGTHRQMTGQEVRMGWKRTWDDAQHWQTIVRASGRWVTDNGSGYYDYNRAEGFLQTRYRGQVWGFSGEVRFTQYNYPVQTVSATDPALRVRSEITLGLTIERSLASWLKVFANYAFDRTYGNRPQDEYSVNTVSAGLSFEF